MEEEKKKNNKNIISEILLVVVIVLLLTVSGILLGSSQSRLNKVKNTFKVFYLVDDCVVYTEEVYKGKSVQNVPTLPEKDNYISSWSKDGSNISEDTIITVSYTPKDFNINYVWGKVTTFDTYAFYESEDYYIFRDATSIYLINKYQINSEKQFTVYNIDNEPISYKFTDLNYTKISHLTNDYSDYDFEGWGFNVLDRNAEFTNQPGYTYYVSLDNSYVWLKYATSESIIDNTYFVYFNGNVLKFTFSDDMNTFTYSKDNQVKTGHITEYITKIDDTIYNVIYSNNKVITKDNNTGSFGETSFIQGGFNIEQSSKQYKVTFDSYNCKCYVIGNVEYKPSSLESLPTTYKYGDSIYIENFKSLLVGYIMDDPTNPYEYQLVPTSDFGTFGLDYLKAFGINYKFTSGTYDTFISNPRGDVLIYFQPSPPQS